MKFNEETSINIKANKFDSCQEETKGKPVQQLV